MAMLALVCSVSICLAGDYDLQGRHVWSAEACSFDCSGLAAAACPLQGIGGIFPPVFLFGRVDDEGYGIAHAPFFALLPFELLMLLSTQCGEMQKQTG